MSDPDLCGERNPPDEGILYRPHMPEWPKKVRPHQRYHVPDDQSGNVIEEDTCPLTAVGQKTQVKSTRFPAVDQARPRLAACILRIRARSVRSLRIHQCRCRVIRLSATRNAVRNHMLCRQHSAFAFRTRITYQEFDAPSSHGCRTQPHGFMPVGW